LETNSIASHILAVLPDCGCKLWVLRTQITGDKAAIDYALIGLQSAGRIVIVDGWIRPAGAAFKVEKINRQPPAPYRGWDTVEHRLRELLRDEG